MSQSDFVGEFLDLHHKLKCGELSGAEEARWKELKGCLTRPPEVGGSASEPIEWDPDLEPVAPKSPGTAGQA